MLSEKQKQIAWDAYIDEDGEAHEQVYAAVEAVLAEQARAAEQGQASERTVKAKWPEAVALNSGAYKAWVILEHPSSNHVLSVRYPQSATAGTESAAWRDAAEILLVDMKQPTQPPAGDRVREVLSEAKTATRELRQSESGDYALCVDCKRQMVFCKCPRPGRTVSNVASPIPAPAGDVVSRDSMQDLLEERDAQWEKAIREMFVDHPDSFGCMDIDEAISYVRARLAKPAEQTDEQKVADILNDSMLENSNDLSRRYLAKKIVAALKAGKQ